MFSSYEPRIINFTNWSDTIISLFWEYLTLLPWINSFMNYPQWQMGHKKFYLLEDKKYTADIFNVHIHSQLLKRYTSEVPSFHLLNHVLLLCVHFEVDKKKTTNYTQEYEQAYLTNNHLEWCVGIHILIGSSYTLLHVLILISNGIYHRVI